MDKSYTEKRLEILNDRISGLFEHIEETTKDLTQSIQATNASIECVIEAQKRYIGGEPPVIKDPNSERIDKILSYITMYKGRACIEGGEYTLSFYHGEIGEAVDPNDPPLTLRIFRTGDHCRDNATREHFDIKEGTIGEAKLGDLFVELSDHDIYYDDICIASFRDNTTISCNHLHNCSIVHSFYNEYSKGLIFTRKQS